MNKKCYVYNEHAKLMAEIALCILEWKNDCLDIPWVKEIIWLYLLIPYATPNDNKLKTPWDDYNIPDISNELFYGKISLSDVRDTICHSFVTFEKESNDWLHWKHLIFDDRIITNKKEHSKITDNFWNYHIPINYISRRLQELSQQVLNN